MTQPANNKAAHQAAKPSIKIGVIGAGGRMGRMLIEAVQDNPQTMLSAAIERQGSSLVGADAGEVAAIDRLDVQIVDDLATVINDIDVLIDFSLPAATEQNMHICAEHNVAMVIGTTGFNEAQEAALAVASEKIAIVYAGNYSTGVNLSLKLLEMAAKAFGIEADVEIIEAHHKHKIDAPSGTALMMAEAVAKGRGQNLKDVAIYGREGQTGARETGTIGIHAIRGGEIVGDHTVMFIADGEMIEITHRARERMTFAAGAVRASTWVVEQAAGHYNMQDVLGLNE